MNWNGVSRLLPYGKIKVDSNYYILIVVDQYDYGLRSIGLLYDKLNDKINSQMIPSENIW